MKTVNELRSNLTKVPGCTYDNRSKKAKLVHSLDSKKIYQKQAKNSK